MDDDTFAEIYVDLEIEFERNRMLYTRILVYSDICDDLKVVVNRGGALRQSITTENLGEFTNICFEYLSSSARIECYYNIIREQIRTYGDCSKFDGVVKRVRDSSRSLETALKTLLVG